MIYKGTTDNTGPGETSNNSFRGVPGAFLAVPLLATFKIFCDNIESLAAIGEFLGQRDEDERRQSARA